MKPGYDGDRFGIEPVRDLEGKGKRDLVRRIRYDVVMWLHKRSLIELHQRDAAIRLQVDDQLAQTFVQTRYDEAGRTSCSFGLPEAILAARGRVRACQELLGLSWPIMELVVLKNLSLAAAAQAAGTERARVLYILRPALDRLAAQYGGCWPNSATRV